MSTGEGDIEYKGNFLVSDRVWVPIHVVIPPEFPRVPVSPVCGPCPVGGASLIHIRPR